MGRRRSLCTNQYILISFSVVSHVVGAAACDGTELYSDAISLSASAGAAVDAHAAAFNSGLNPLPVGGGAGQAPPMLRITSSAVATAAAGRENVGAASAAADRSAVAYNGARRPGN